MGACTAWAPTRSDTLALRAPPRPSALVVSVVLRPAPSARPAPAALPSRSRIGVAAVSYSAAARTLVGSRLRATAAPAVRAHVDFHRLVVVTRRLPVALGVQAFRTAAKLRHHAGRAGRSR
jgi:hypothetical protein